MGVPDTELSVAALFERLTDDRLEAEGSGAGALRSKQRQPILKPSVTTYHSRQQSTAKHLAHRSQVARQALEHAGAYDPHPVVRKIARWYIPGGPLYKRLAPKAAR